MSENPLEVVLGDRTYVLREQRIGRIGRKLSAVVDLFAGVGTGVTPTDIGPQLYDTLKIFIDDLDPQWKLAGYPSEEAYQALEKHEEKVRKARERFAATHGPKAEGVEKSEVGFADLPPETQAEFKPPAFEDPYDEAADHSPTPSQILDAIEAIFALHGGQRMVRLLRTFLTPRMIQQAILTMQNNAAVAALARSQSAQRASGESAQTSSSTPSPTPETADSLGSLLPGS